MTHNKKLTAFLCTTVMLVGLFGCATTTQTHEEVEKNQALIEQRTLNAARTTDAAQRDTAYSQIRPIISEKPWVSTQAVKRRPDLPQIFEMPVTLSVGKPKPINELFFILSQQTGLNIRYENDLISAPSGQQDNTDSASATGMTGMDNAVTPFNTGEGNEGYSPMRASSDAPVQEIPALSIQVSGSVREVMDRVALKLDASWRYSRENNEVVFYRYETRVFPLKFSSDSNVLKSTFSVQSGFSGTNDTLSGERKMNPVDDVRRVVRSMLSDKGRMEITMSPATLVVRDYPDNVRRIGEYIRKINNAYSRQVILKVEILKFERNLTDNRGLGYDFKFADGTSNAIISSTPLAISSGDITGTLLSVGQGEGSKHFTASQLVVQSLSRSGKVSSLSSMNYVTVSNRPVIVRAAKEQSYIKDVQVPADNEDTSSTVALTQDTKTVGLSMVLVPEVAGNGRDVFVTANIKISSLQLEEKSFGNYTVQLPSVASRDLNPAVWMRSSQTLVLAGFRMVDTALNKTGLTDASSWWLGGNKQATNANEELVILITPYVTNTSL